MKTIKLTFLISSFFLLFNCSSDDDSNNIITEEVTFSDFEVTTSPSNDSAILDWEDVTASNNEEITYGVYLDDILQIDNLSNSTFTLNDLEEDIEYILSLNSTKFKYQQESTKERIKVIIYIEATTSSTLKITVLFYPDFVQF